LNGGWPALTGGGLFLGRYQSGQMGQTVNLLANAFEGSIPSLPTVIYKTKMAKQEIRTAFNFFRKEIKKLFPEVILMIGLEENYKTYQNYIYLHKIKVDEKVRGKGLAKLVLESLCDFCDLYKLDMYLAATNADNADLVRLVDFYKRFEFVVLDKNDFKTNSVDMYRKYKIT
jgi:GNAT superfamily N-acetyltransferase